MVAPHVGHVEHVHRIRFPPVDNDDSVIKAVADEVARKTFPQERPKFTYFPRLPPEIQTMIWEATLEPKTFRAWAYSDEPAVPDYPGGHNDDPLERRWILVECDPYRWAQIPLFYVCRLSRALALSTYGTPGPAFEGNFPIFHRDLDTIEVLGHSPGGYEIKWGMYPLISRESSDIYGIESVLVRVRKAVSWQKSIFFGHPIHGYENETPVRSRQDWLILGMHQLNKPRRVVLCHDLRVASRLTDIVEWAHIVFPDIECLELRAYIDPLEGDPGAYTRERDRMARYVNQMMHMRKTEGGWRKLRTVDFTRQAVPETRPHVGELD